MNDMKRLLRYAGPYRRDMVLGAVLAVCSIDLKRTFACSSVSQIGFILVGVSM